MVQAEKRRGLFHAYDTGDSYIHVGEGCVFVCVFGSSGMFL